MIPVTESQPKQIIFRKWLRFLSRPGVLPADSSLTGFIVLMLGGAVYAFITGRWLTAHLSSPQKLLVGGLAGEGDSGNEAAG